MAPFDPFKRYVATPEGPASRLFPITPSDTDHLPIAVKCVRIFNSMEEIAFIAVSDMSGGAPVTLPIPPLCVLWEEIRVSHVWATGTTPGLIIHGYTE